MGGTALRLAGAKKSRRMKSFAGKLFKENVDGNLCKTFLRFAAAFFGDEEQIKNHFCSD